MLKLIGDKNFIPLDGVVAPMLSPICHVSPDACVAALAALCGTSASINATRMEVYFSAFPCGTSTKNIQQWAQLALNRGEVTDFDYGVHIRDTSVIGLTNRAVYGQRIPPKYDLDNYAVPTALFR